MVLATEGDEREAASWEDQHTPLAPQDTLEVALRRFDSSGEVHMAVAEPADPTRIIGWASRLDALEAYNNALIKANVEEHR
jgi:CIC family chloride channel protein